MSGERFTFDTNILVYAADHLAGARHQLAIDLMNRATGRDCILTLQSLAEFYHAATRKGIVPVREAADQVRDWMTIYPVASADEATFGAALQISTAKKLSIWDSMLIATAASAGCAVVVSEDMQHGQRLGDVRLCHPFNVDSLSEDVLQLLGDEVE